MMECFKQTFIKADLPFSIEQSQKKVTAFSLDQNQRGLAVPVDQTTDSFASQRVFHGIVLKVERIHIQMGRCAVASRCP
jgi:hypothetical protein